MSDLVLEFDKVRKDYRIRRFPPRWFPAVRETTLAVRRGEVFGLIGPNRAGKTTLIKMLLSLCQPTAGTIRRLGSPARDRQTLARVGYMHENQAFPRYLSAYDLLRYYAVLSLTPLEPVRARLPRLLERVGLADRGFEPIARFSKGMVQRLALAQALVNEPELLVLDEPLEGLDLLGRRLLHDVVREVRQSGRTVLLVSHSTSDVEELCDRVGVMVGGRLVQLGTVAEVAGGPQRPLAAALQKLYEGSPA
ncbi:MAG TPA: ABC transporter ATP-binding protein [Gemmatales bacterium]|nr:ABC transporter ATP-binding protein [Gemmatales bacterium]HMP61162.1 ABC transporter ATP-binding protein [Gemmatales bacterium]